MLAMPRWIALALLLPLTLLAALAAALPPAPPAPPLPAAASAPEISLPALRLEYSAPAVVLSGVVPDQAERRALVMRLRAIYGKAHVRDHVKVGAVANPAWLSADFLPDLRGTVRAVAELRDARLQVEAQPSSDAAGRRLAAELDALRARGIAVELRRLAPR
jgi:hypothetical protein